MSWDVMIYNFRGAALPTAEELEELEALEEIDSEPLGRAAEVRKQISDLLPGVDWSDPNWGVYEGEGFTIEFNMVEEDPVRNMMLHVRGGGDAIPAIMAFVQPLGWSALDCSSFEFLDSENPSDAGWKAFQTYRDQVIAQYNSEKESEPEI